MLSHNHQRVASCLGPTKIQRSTSLSCKPPTLAGEHPKPRKHAIIFYVEVRMLLLISAEFIGDGNSMKVDVGGILFTSGIFFFFDKHISELIVKVQLCQTVFSLPQLSDYSVHPEGYRSGKSWDSRCALSHSTAVGVHCLSRNTSSILMSWTDTRGTVPSPDLNLSKWFFHVFLQCFPSGCYSGTTADGGWCPPASWRCFGAKVCQICQLGHQGAQCSWQASYSGKTATQMTSHCSSEEKNPQKTWHIRMFVATSASL